MSDPVRLYNPNPDAPDVWGAPPTKRNRLAEVIANIPSPFEVFAPPPAARKAYGSLAQTLVDATAPAAVRDTVDASGQTMDALRQGRGWDAAGGVAGMLTAAAGVLPGGLLLTKGAKELAQPIRAYHGSPNSFDRFDMSKAGSTTDSGHLGQAIYAATDEKVAAPSAHRYEISISPQNPLNIELPDFRTDKRDVIRDALGLPRTATAAEVSAEATRRGYDATVLDYSPTGYAAKEIAAYNPAIIEILRKYGLLPVAAGTAVAGGAALSTPQPDEGGF